jgi:exonuclease SbcD
VEWRRLAGIRPFVDRFVRLESQSGIHETLRRALSPPDQLAGAVVRLVIEYPRDWESLIDDSALKEHARDAFEFHLVKRPLMESRIRLPEDQTLGSLTALELLDLYWKASHTDPDETEALNELARQVLDDFQVDRETGSPNS